MLHFQCYTPANIIAALKVVHTSISNIYACPACISFIHLHQIFFNVPSYIISTNRMIYNNKIIIHIAAKDGEEEEKSHTCNFTFYIRSYS